MLHEPWTEERVEQLRELWDRGLSASLIAREMGTTRCAVIGKLYRLRFPARNVRARYSWSPERVARLTALWASGMSAQDIAAELRAPSRQVIYSKIHELGLTRRERPRPAKKAKPAKPQRTYKVASYHPWDDGTRHYPRPVVETCPTEGTIGLLDLTPRTCKYPFGDPKGGMTYCGGRTAHGSPYCTAHHRLTHKPVEERDLREEKLARRVSRMAARRMYMAEAAE